MYVISGASGRIGSVVADRLLDSPSVLSSVVQKQPLIGSLEGLKRSS